MKAARLYSGKHELVVEDVPHRIPGPGEIRIRVRTCGVCGSDVHLVLHGTMRAKHYPVTPGHEIAGDIIEMGKDVAGFQPGDRVVVAAGSSCGECRHCLSGNENLCRLSGVFGFECDGGYAEEFTVHARYATKLPHSIPYDQGAILADAVSTPYHALSRTGALKPGDTVAVFGCGGLGVHAIACARALGAGKIAALDVASGALENAGRAGAAELINVKSVKSAGKALKEAVGGVDVVVDFSGRYENVEEALRAMNEGGRIVLVGLGRGKMDLSMPAALIFKQVSIRGSYGSDRRSMPELIALVESGKLELSHSISGHLPLEDANRAIHDLENRVGNPVRLILTP